MNIFCSAIGSLNIFSSSFVTADLDFHNPYYFLIRHFIVVLIGTIGFFVGKRVNYQIWRDKIVYIYFLTLLLLLLVVVHGVTINGAKRWINLIWFQLQPSELVKIVGVILTSSYISACAKMHRDISLFNKNIVAVGVLALLVLEQPDLGTSMIIIGVPIIMYIVAGIDQKTITILLIGTLLALVLLVWAKPYRWDRIMIWYDPWARAQGDGYQTVQSIIAIGSGGFWGMGIGKGVAKYAYLPEAHTDFAFAIFSQEMGMIGVVCIFILYMIFYFYAWRVAIKARDVYGRLLGFGIVALLVSQTLINLAMVIGLLPVVGVPLPFISYGGTALLVNMFMLGILQNISLVTDKYPLKLVPKEGKTFGRSG